MVVIRSLKSFTFHNFVINNIYEYFEIYKSYMYAIFQTIFNYIDFPVIFIVCT